jgi:hypothetical protein
LRDLPTPWWLCTYLYILQLSFSRDAHVCFFTNICADNLGYVVNVMSVHVLFTFYIYTIYKTKLIV